MSVLLQTLVTFILTLTYSLIGHIFASMTADDDVTVGKFYATFLIQDYFRRFKRRKEVVKQETHAQVANEQNEQAKALQVRPTII